MAESEIKKVSKYLQLPIGKLSYTDDNIIQMKTSGENKVVGFSSILNYLHNIIEKENRTKENYFLTKQFFDYANQFIRNTSKRDKYSGCSEINSYLETRTYLIGQSVSLADLVVFYAISEVMKQLSPTEKEQFLNLSRWFDHLQQQDSIRQGSNVVNFSTIHLHGQATRA